MSVSSGSRGRLAVLASLCGACLLGASALACLAILSTSASADQSLGGYTVTSLGEAMTVQYEQPNLPIPATPTLEVDEGYTATSQNYGPTGNAVASTLYPGQVLANLGPSIGVAFPSIPLPPLPEWPVQAVSFYPENPNTASSDEPGVNMDTSSGASGSTATATLGNDVPTAGSAASAGSAPSTSTGNPLATSSSLFGVAGLTSTSSSSTTDTTADASATATDSGISILGGFINIGAVTSTATAASDGTTGSVSGSTSVTGVTIAGESVSVNAGGIQAAGKSIGVGVPISAINTILKELGITIAITAPDDTVQGASASRTLTGLSLSINLDTLDAAVNKFASLLPASVVSQLPLPLPNEQTITFEFGEVTASSAAAPGYSDLGATGGSGGTPSTTDQTAPESTFTQPSTSGSTGIDGAIQSGSGLSTTPTNTSAPQDLATPGQGPQVIDDEPARFSSQIGAGLFALFVLAALVTAYIYKRMDDVSENWGTACETGTEPSEPRTR